MVKAVVFDLDDTLYPEREFVRSGFLAVGRWLEDRLGVKGFFAVSMALFQSGIRGNVFDRALGELGCQPTPDLIQQLVEVYRTHKPDIRLYEDAKDVLPTVKFHELRAAIITDGYLETQKRKVASLGISHLFDCIVYTDAFGRENWKPSPVPYRSVMDALALRGTDCVYVGDNPKKDFVTARDLGWLTIRVDRGEGEHTGAEAPPSHRADQTIPSLLELPGALGLG